MCFHRFLSNTNNFQSILLKVIDRIITGSTTLGQSEPGSNGNKEEILQISRTGAALLDLIL